jgi:thiol-disulfide isomerase/thioredoxin
MIQILSCLAALVISAPANGKYLTVGDPAPTLASAHWVKGQAQPRFEKGKIYVVEFWATWCSPCKANIPKLTALAAKYKDAITIEGVSVWESLDKEDPGALKKVKAFVASEGDKMRYNVAADDTANTVANRWMKAAGEDGLPCTFVIDKTGHVAWIGHAEQLEAVLPQIIDNHWDLAVAKQARETEKEIVRPVMEAMEAKHYKDALAAMAVSLKKRPDMERFFAYDRLVCLFYIDIKQATAEAERILTEAKGEIGAYQMIGSIPASQEDMSPAAFEYGLAIDKRALEKTDNDRQYMFLSMEAATSWNLKRRDDAIQLESQAIDAAEHDTHAPAPFIEFLKRTLAKFQKGK